MDNQTERLAAVELFKEIKKQTKADDTACAILTAIEMHEDVRHKMSRILDKDVFEHVICMGIRAAIFGTGASHTETIQSLADPLSEIAKAIRDSQAD